jgi:hypothetical protein
LVRERSPVQSWSSAPEIRDTDRHRDIEIEIAEIEIAEIEIRNSDSDRDDEGRGFRLRADGGMPTADLRAGVTQW